MGTTNILDLNNRVSELAQSYPASKVLLNSGDSVEERVDANIISQAARVDISSYGESNPYTCPTDGYVVIRSDSDSNSGGFVKVNGSLLLNVVSGTRITLPMYVKKGAIAYCSVSGTAIVYFYPLS